MDGLSVSAVQRGQSPWTMPYLPTIRGYLSIWCMWKRRRRTRIIDNNSDSYGRIRKATSYAHLALIIVDVGDESFIQIAQLLENIDYAGNISAANKVREDLRHASNT
jgi:hypothetical protein